MIVKPKICGYAILSLVLGVLSLLFFVLTAIPAIVVGIISIVTISGSGGALRGRGIAAAGIVFSILWTVAVCLLWWIDAPPIPDDYTIADLRSAPVECAESFEILKTLVDEEHDLPGAPAIGLTQEDLAMSEKIRWVVQKGTASEISEILNYHADDIEQAWIRMKKARDVVKRLNTYVEIADFAEPNVDAEIMRFRNLIEMARFYQVYGHLKIEQHDIQEFTGELIELDSVFRKLSVNVRMFISKLICFVSIRENIATANAIANNARAPMNAIELLAEHFVPLTHEQMSLRNGALFTYLMSKSAFSDTLASGAVVKIPFLKANSTLRVYRKGCDDWLNQADYSGGITGGELSVWPDFYPFDEPDPAQSGQILHLIYRCYNPVGSQLLRINGFYKAPDPRKGAAISVSADLLQIVLNKRLGEEVSLKARVYSDEYIVDVDNKRIFSPGPDGKADTRDDIELPINPEVLGW